MSSNHTPLTTFDEMPEWAGPPFPDEGHETPSPSATQRLWMTIKSAPWHKWMMMAGVTYTVIWSILLYFGWKGSPNWITWMDLATGAVLIHLVYLLHRETDFSHLSLLLRILQMISLFYATAWTVIIMFMFGVEILLPLDFISLYVTISLMRQLARSLGISPHLHQNRSKEKQSLT